MADNTNTASTFVSIPQYTHAPGTQTVTGKYGSSLSVSELVKVARVPANATVLDWKFIRPGGASTAVVLQARKWSSSSSTTVQGLHTASVSGMYTPFGERLIDGTTTWATKTIPLVLTATAGMLQYVDLEFISLSATHTETIHYQIQWTSNPAQGV